MGSREALPPEVHAESAPMGKTVRRICSVCSGLGWRTQIEIREHSGSMSNIQCVTCEGRGYFDVDACPYCSGTGEKKWADMERVTIPRRTPEERAEARKSLPGISSEQEKRDLRPLTDDEHPIRAKPEVC